MEFLRGRWMNSIPGKTDRELLESIRHQESVIKRYQHSTTHLAKSTVADAREFLEDAYREIRNRGLTIPDPNSYQVKRHKPKGKA
jgi:hypothetical protein